MNAHAKWKFACNAFERNTLVLQGTGDHRIDGIPLAFAGDPPGTAQACLDGINQRRALLGLDAIVITNTHLSQRAP